MGRGGGRLVMCSGPFFYTFYLRCLLKPGLSCRLSHTCRHSWPVLLPSGNTFCLLPPTHSDMPTHTDVLPQSHQVMKTSQLLPTLTDTLDQSCWLPQTLITNPSHSHRQSYLSLLLPILLSNTTFLSQQCLPLRHS